MAKSTKSTDTKSSKKGGGKYTAGAGSGLGRLQKIKAYGAKSKG